MGGTKSERPRVHPPRSSASSGLRGDDPDVAVLTQQEQVTAISGHE